MDFWNVILDGIPSREIGELQTTILHAEIERKADRMLKNAGPDWQDRLTTVFTQWFGVTV